MKNFTNTPDFVILPKEEMLETGFKKSNLTIGVPKETDSNEKRVPLTPLAVSYLVSEGHKIIVEKNAGAAANYTDYEYSEAGAVIIDDHEMAYKSEIILKVAPFTVDEIELLKPNQTIFSALHASTQTFETISKLIDKKVRAIAFEYLKSEKDFFPIMHSMSEIAGCTAIIVAAELMSNQNNGKGVLLGGVTGITPTEIVILGSGTATEYATRVALGLGAMVKIFDSSIYKLSILQEKFGKQLFTSTLHPKVLNKALHSADIVICAMENNLRNEIIINKDMVGSMKKNSVIIDLNIDNGTYIETSRATNFENPTYVDSGIIHYCVPNIASRVSRTASIALSNILTPLLINIAYDGGIVNCIKNNAGLQNGTYVFNGILTNKTIGQKVGIQHKDIELLMAAF